MQLWIPWAQYLNTIVHDVSHTEGLALSRSPIEFFRRDGTVPASNTPHRPRHRRKDSALPKRMPFRYLCPNTGITAQLLNALAHRTLPSQTSTLTLTLTKRINTPKRRPSRHLCPTFLIVILQAKTTNHHRHHHQQPIIIFIITNNQSSSSSSSTTNHHRHRHHHQPLCSPRPPG